MFTWICPQCGKEVQPHENECPYCGGSASKASADESKDVRAVVAESAQQQAARPASRPAVPGWVVALGVAVLMCLLGAGVYYLIGVSRSRSASAEPLEFEPVPEVSEVVTGGRMARFIEVTGFRITEDDSRRAQIQFLVVNHSSADFGDLAGKVLLHASGDEPSKEPIAEFEFKTTRLAPYASIEFRTAISTKLRAYEIPDWQYLRAEVEITSPADM